MPKSRPGKLNPAWAGGYEKKCAYCPATFWVKPSHAQRRVACSKTCLSTHVKTTGEWRGRTVVRPFTALRLSLVCKECNEVFERVEKRAGLFCSRSCSMAWHGRKRIGALNSNFGNGIAVTGAKNPAWKGGISFEPYSTDFVGTLKRKIRVRDGHACSICRTQQEQLPRALDIHHIDYDKKNTAESNLVALCQSCHAKTNYRRQEWIDFFAART